MSKEIVMARIDKLIAEERHELQLREENEQLRELLKKCQPYIAGWPEARELFSEIQKEVNDE